MKKTSLSISILIIFTLTVLIHTVSSWCLRTVFAGVTSMESIDFSPDGEYIVTGQISGRVLLWKTNTLQILYTYTFPSRLWAVTYSKNQQYIGIAGEQDDIQIVSGNNLAYIKNIPTGHGKVFDLDFRFDSRTVLTCGDDKKSKIWNITDLNKLSEVSDQHQAYTCEYSSSDWYAVAGAHFIETYDTNDNQIYQYHNHAVNIFYGLRIRPTADFCISVSDDGKIFESDMNTSSTDTQISGTSGGLWDCAYSRDATYFATGGDNGLVYLYNATNQANSLESVLLTQSTTKIKTMQFSYDSNNLVVGNQDGQVYFYQRFCHGCPVGSYPNKTVCKLCAETLVGCSICLNSTVCRSCLSGYYINNGACKSCDIIEGCTNCNSSTRCTLCFPGFYLNGLTCTRCLGLMYGCHQCLSPTVCLECDKNSYLSGNTCIACTTLNLCIYCNSSSYCLQCRPGYYSNAGVCTLCESAANPFCLICSSAINCTSCASGYHVNSSRLCEKCAPECLFCDNANRCFDCVETMYVNVAFTCAFCVHPCETCNSTTYCHSCVQGYYRSAAGVCTNCPAGCLSCNTSTRCQSCDVGYYLNIATHICNKCSILLANCRECVPSACLACELEYHLTGGSCAQCSQLIPNCEICDSTSICDQCTAGYYPTGLANALSCAMCEPACTNCKSATACYACEQGYYLSAFDCFLCTSNCLACSSSAASACTSCVEGFYLSTTTTGSCISCSGINKCTACLNSSYCLGCDVGYFLSSPTLCTLCAAPCTSCKTSASDCLTCALGYYIYTTGGGTGACAQCNAECSDCSTSASTCLNCVQGYYHNNVTLTCTRCITALSGCSICENATSCIMCADGYYPVGSACQPCSPHILKCLRCNTLGTLCSMCDYGYALSVTNTSCISCATTLAFCEHCTTSAVCQTCKPGYFTNGTTCVPCSIGCINCVNASICENCITTYILVSNGTCLNCQDAIVGCHLCTSTTTCTDCVFGFYLTAPTCSLCRVALPGCEHCSSATTCLQCSVFYQLQTNATCALCSSVYANCQLCSVSAVDCLDCQVGYYLFNGSCFSCGNATSEGCLKCTSNTTCTECMNGYFLNTTSSLCQKCDLTFSSCIYCTPSLCLQCESGFYLTAGGVCTACPSEGCEICIWNNPAQCVGCNSRYYLSGSQCFLCSNVMPQCLQCTNSTLCVHCANGYYLTNLSQCSLCSDAFPGCQICTSSGCSNCFSNFFINSTDLACHNCTDYLPGCAYCISQSICTSCQNGFYMVNSTCEYCAIITGCLYCINGSYCSYCQETYYLSSSVNASSCLKCDVMPGCFSCSDGLTCLSCKQNFKLVSNQCIQIKGQVMRKYTSIGIKSTYVNDTCLKHTFFARSLKFAKVDQDWSNVTQLTLISKNYTYYTLTILKVEWSANLQQLIFYTNNPIADQLSQSVKNMPLIKTSRLLIQASTDLGFNLKFMMTEDATHAILPNLQHLGDLYLDYPYSNAQFYESYLRNRPYYYFLFGLIVTIALLVGYSMKICCMLPDTKQRGYLIPHIFAIKCAGLAVYPTFAQYTNYCYGFMTADLPWFNSFFGDKLGNNNDVMPEVFSMYYANLSLVSTYFTALFFIILVWFFIGCIGLICVSVQSRLESFKSLLYNMFSLGAIIAGCLSLQGIILNPIQSVSANSAFYIIGIILYFGIFIQIMYSWSSQRSLLLSKLNNAQDDIGTVNHFRKLRIFIKATLLSLMHISPLYFISTIFCVQFVQTTIQHCLIKDQQKYCPKSYFCQHICINLSLLLLMLIPDAILGLLVSSFMSIVSIMLEIYIVYYEYKYTGIISELQIDANNTNIVGKTNLTGNELSMQDKFKKLRKINVYEEEFKNQQSHDNLFAQSSSKATIQKLKSPTLQSSSPSMYEKQKQQNKQRTTMRKKYIQKQAPVVQFRVQDLYQ